MRTPKRGKTLGVYAGSFDPLTIGHLWMIEQGVRLFDEFVVAIGMNPDKKYRFSQEERLQMLWDSIKPFPNITVEVRDRIFSTDWFWEKNRARRNLQVSLSAMAHPKDKQTDPT